MKEQGLWFYEAYLGPLSDRDEVEATNRVEAWNKAYEACRFDQFKQKEVDFVVK